MGVWGQEKKDLMFQTFFTEISAKLKRSDRSARRKQRHDYKNPCEEEAQHSIKGGKHGSNKSNYIKYQDSPHVM